MLCQMNLGGRAMVSQAKQGTPAFLRINVGLFLGGFVTFALLWGLQPLLPVLTQAFRISPTTASYSLSSTTLVLAVAMLLASSVSDRFGRKQLMVIAVFASSLLQLVISLAPTFGFLIALRALQGVTLAGLPAVAMAYLGEEVAGASLGLAMGLYIAGNALGGMVGRILTSTLADAFGWRVAVAIVACLCFVFGVAFIAYLPASKNYIRRRTPLKALLSTFVVHLRNRRLQSLYGIAFFIMAAFAALYNFIGFRWLAPPYSLSQTTVGFIFIVYIVGMGSSAWMGRLSDKYGRGRVLTAAIATMVLGVLLTAARSLLPQIVGVCTFTFGFFGAHAIASAWVGASARVSKAQASSLYLLAYYVGSSVGGSFSGVVWQQAGWTGMVVYLLAVLLLCSGLCWWLQQTNASQTADGY